MKELSIEEKARRYESALEKCRKLYKEAKANEYTSDIEDYETIFPELKESEDERARKRLIAMCQHYIECYAFDQFNLDGYKEVLAWLEKQGENSSNKIPIWKHWKDGIAGNGEGKPIYLIKDGGTYRISSVLGYECDYIELSDLDELKQNEQKPIECIKFNNEFENQVSNLLASVLNGEHEYNESFVKYVAQSLLGYAKNELKPVEWSEEDEKMVDKILTPLAIRYPLDIYQPMYNWLKSLKQRHVWKPSEEQMRALHDMNLTGNISYAGQGQTLIELYNDLKKL